jgi:hypothetical protein
MFVQHDTTGTQTVCPKPLSRKVLPESLAKSNRKGGRRRWPLAWQKREERAKLRKLFTKRTLADGTTVQLIPNAAEVEEMKPTIFERLGGMFGKLRTQLERGKAKGK